MPSRTVGFEIGDVSLKSDLESSRKMDDKEDIVVEEWSSKSVMFPFWNGNNELEDVRVLCTMKPESVISEKAHTWKTILFRTFVGW